MSLKKLSSLDKRIRFLMANKLMDFDELEKLPTKFFNKHVDHIMDFLGQYADGINETDCNHDKECMRQAVMSKLIFRMSYARGTNNDQQFGSFLKSFASILLDEFNPDKYLMLFCFFGSCSKDLCKNLDSNEKSLHDYFANLSKAFGFSEKISLLEVPSLISFYGDTYSVKKPEFFMHFRCNKHGKISAGDLMDCTKPLSHFHANITKGIEGTFFFDQHVAYIQ